MVRIPKWGIGGIVINDPMKPWVTPENFSNVLSECVFDLGIHYLDTAQRYGDAESVIGKWLEAHSRQQPLVIGTKIGPPDNSSNCKNTFNDDYIFSSAKSSLKRLNLSKVDIYWMHNPDPNTGWEITLAGFDRVITSGLANSFGVSNVTCDDLKNILSICKRYDFQPPQFVQNEFNLLVQQSELPLIKLCHALDLSYMAFSPLAGGILTGKYQYNHFPEIARWSHWRNTRGLPPYWTEKNFLALEELKIRAQGKHCSVGSLALAWVHRHGGIDTTLVGPRNIEQTLLVKEAKNLDLTDEEHESITNLFL